MGSEAPQELQSGDGSELSYLSAGMTAGSTVSTAVQAGAEALQQKATMDGKKAALEDTSSFRLDRPEQYGRERGVFTLLLSERHLLRKFLPPGVSLILLDDLLSEETRTKSSGSRAEKAKASSKGKGKGGPRADPAQKARSSKPQPRSLASRSSEKELAAQAKDSLDKSRSRSGRGRAPPGKTPKSVPMKTNRPPKKETAAASVRGRRLKAGRDEEQEDPQEESEAPEEDMEEDDEEQEEKPSSMRGGRGGGRGRGTSRSRGQGSDTSKKAAKPTRTKSKAESDEPAQAKKQKTAAQKPAAQIGLPEEPPRAPPVPKVSQGPSVAVLMTPQEKADLQAKIDELSDEQLDRVIEFLTPDLPQNGDSEDVNLDLDSLSAERQQALRKLVDAEIAGARQETDAAVTSGPPAGPSAPATAASGQGMMSPSFPVLEPGATPRSAPATPRSEQAGSEGSARDAKRQHAWEACVAREVQKQSHLRDIREAASASNSTPGATPQGGNPTTAEPPAGMPELTLPPAGVPEASSSAPAAAAPAEVEVPAANGGSADSMLDATQDVLALVNDFSTWM